MKKISEALKHIYIYDLDFYKLKDRWNKTVSTDFRSSLLINMCIDGQGNYIFFCSSMRIPSGYTLLSTERIKIYRDKEELYTKIHCYGGNRYIIKYIEIYKNIE